MGHMLRLVRKIYMLFHNGFIVNSDGKLVILSLGSSDLAYMFPRVLVVNISKIFNLVSTGTFYRL